MFDPCTEIVQPPENAPGLHEESAARFRSRAVRRAVAYMHANLADSVRLEDIAGAVGLSVFHFSRTFRHATGLAPHRYLIQARTERVKVLLLESEQSLAAIAKDAGFSDQSHMSKVFRKITGTTPKYFRDTCGIAFCVSGCRDDRKGSGQAARE